MMKGSRKLSCLRDVAVSSWIWKNNRNWGSQSFLWDQWSAIHDHRWLWQYFPYYLYMSYTVLNTCRTRGLSIWFCAGVMETNVGHGLHLQHIRDEKCLHLHPLINEIQWLGTTWQCLSALTESITSHSRGSSLNLYTVRNVHFCKLWSEFGFCSMRCDIWPRKHLPGSSVRWN
jgi:hypothetical protein